LAAKYWRLDKSAFSHFSISADLDLCRTDSFANVFKSVFNRIWELEHKPQSLIVACSDAGLP
jgi:hypothetical protein